MRSVRFGSLGVRLVIGIWFGSLVGTAPLAQASLHLITERSALPTSDSIDWQHAFAAAEYQQIAAPAWGRSNLGARFQLSSSSTTAGERRNQSSGWHGNFAVGDHLLWTNGAGPLRIDLGLTNIHSGGVQIQSAHEGVFVAQLSAYDVHGTLLGSVTRQGHSNGLADGSAIFLGLVDDDARIHSFVIRLLTEPHGQTSDFAINQFDFSNLLLADVTLPEPAAVTAWTVLGTLALAAHAWLTKRAARMPAR